MKMLTEKEKTVCKFVSVRWPLIAKDRMSVIGLMGAIL